MLCSHIYKGGAAWDKFVYKLHYIFFSLLDDASHGFFDLSWAVAKLLYQDFKFFPFANSEAGDPQKDTYVMGIRRIYNPSMWCFQLQNLTKTCKQQTYWVIPGSREISGSGFGSVSSPSLSIWRRKKEMSKEGLIAAKELKRLQSHPVRLQRFINSHVSRLLKSDLVSVLVEFQRQDQVFLSMKLYDVVRKEIWYRPDMFFYRDMLMMLARNTKVNEAKLVWEDLRREEVLFDQHTFGDIIRAFLDNGLPSEAMDIYEEMRRSPDPPLSLPFRVILKGLIPYPELREKVKDDFLELFPNMIVYDPPEDLFENQDSGSEDD